MLHPHSHVHQCEGWSSDFVAPLRYDAVTFRQHSSSPRLGHGNPGKKKLHLLLPRVLVHQDQPFCHGRPGKHSPHHEHQLRQLPKRPRVQEDIQLPWGDGIVNADSESWKWQRKAMQGHLTHVKFQRYLGKITRDKMENGLMKFFDKLAENNVEADLQDLFRRLTFDMTCKLVTGFDPGSLSDHFPKVVLAKAMDNAEEAIFYRHWLPEWTLRLQRILGIGTEEKLRIAQRDLDQILATYIQIKREQLRKPSLDTNEEADGSDLLTSYILDEKFDDKFLRDTILILIFAGRDTIGLTLTWFFYNLSENPSVEEKIREEIRSLIPHEKKIDLRVFQEKLLLDKMVYLHGSLCESLRIYPPISFNHKSPTKPDILPSGHRVDANTKIIFNLYSMGRMKSIWGEDCSKFRPERWISEKGGIKHEPSYKFLSFSAGPMSCPGKDVALTQIKTVVAAILHDYEVRVVEGQKVVPSSSIILQMRHGLKVKINRRN